MNKISKYLFLFIFMLGLTVFLQRIPVMAEEGQPLDVQITVSNGASVYDMTNDSYYSMATFNSQDTISVTSQTPVKYIYIAWNNKTVSPWELTYNGTTAECGKKGYLHELVTLDGTATELSMKITSDGMNICKLFFFGEGALPSWVQNWDDPCDKADILLVSTHADDEQLFFGGIIPYYAGELKLKVEVVYFTNYWNGANIREHEKLDGLWHVGVTHYPVNGDFDDIYADSLESAKTVYDYDAAKAFITEMIRRFKPLVMVGQDLNGEYGHGGHMLTAAACTEAVDLAADINSYPESANTYGTYDVPKLYLHLYPENEITLDCRTPLAAFDGKTDLEVASEGYALHASQQWCWFYVDDTYQYSCARFGLYRTTVGTDTGNDIMEHVVSYEEQESIAESIAESESIEASIAESVSVAESESESQSEFISQSESESIHLQEEKQQAHKLYTLITILSVLAAFLILLIIIFLVIKKKRR